MLKLSIKNKKNIHPIHSELEAEGQDIKLKGAIDKNMKKMQRKAENTNYQY